MSVTSRILALIRQPIATSKELRDTLAGLDIPGAERLVDELEVQRRRLLLQDGADDQIDALDVRIRAANREVERLYAAKEELQAKITEAEGREKKSTIEDQATAARVLQRELIKDYYELHTTAVRLTALVAKVLEGERQIVAANQFTRENDRADLHVATPMALLRAQCGIDPARLPRIADWVMPGYLDHEENELRRKSVNRSTGDEYVYAPPIYPLARFADVVAES